MSKKRAGHKLKRSHTITVCGLLTLALALASPLVACNRETPDGQGSATSSVSLKGPPDSAVTGLVAETPAKGPPDARRAGPCPIFRPPAAQGRVTSNRLTEISGLAVSNSQPLLWTHNDSGDAARLYAINSEGKWLATHTLPAGIEAVDIEDMAVEARSGGADLIYLADTGDNFHRRYGGVYVHRFEEPHVVPGSPSRETTIPSVETMRVLYPDGPRDTETLIVDPTSGEIVFVSKSRFGYGNVYSTPRFSSRAEVELVGSLTPDATNTVIPMVTGGDVSRDGRWLALRTYEGVYLFTRRPGTRLAEALLTTPCRLDAAAEQQGEAIALLGGENEPPSFFTISEGTGVPLYRSGPLKRAPNDSFDLSQGP